MLIPRLIERKGDGTPLDDAETVSLTAELLGGGERFNSSALRKTAVDALATGGYGDKSQLILAPLISSLGVPIPMLSHRVFRHMQGTLDKLDAIPALRTRMSEGEALMQLRRIGCVIIESPDNFSPQANDIFALSVNAADGPDIPLMAASIMAQKLSQSLGGLVVDVTYGGGSILRDEGSASQLARLLVHIGSQLGCDTVATAMAAPVPLGRAVGRALEIEEAIHVLQGESDMPQNLMGRVFRMGVEMLRLSGIESDPGVAQKRIEKAIESGSALRQLAQIIEAQGGNPAIVDDPALLPQSSEVEVFRAPEKGHIVHIDADAIGRGLAQLCSGQASDAAAGFMITVRMGEWVDSGEAIATVFANDLPGIEAGQRALGEAIRISRSPTSATADVS